MKNPYTKTAKLFSKSDFIAIQRVRDEIFLCESHIIVKMHVAAYDAFIRPVSGRFIEMHDGDKATSRNNAIASKENSIDLVSMYNNDNNKAVNPVYPTPFLMEFTRDGKKKEFQRMFTGDGYYISINNDFYALCEEIGFSEYRNAGGSIQPIISDSGSNGIMILPIRYKQDTLDRFINAGEA